MLETKTESTRHAYLRLLTVRASGGTLSATDAASLEAATLALGLGEQNVAQDEADLRVDATEGAAARSALAAAKKALADGRAKGLPGTQLAELLHAHDAAERVATSFEHFRKGRPDLFEEHARHRRLAD